MSAELSSKRQLTSLPLEVLRHIVELGTCDNALTLRSVCREFWALCNDPLAYSAIIESGNGCDNFDAYEALPKPEWWDNHREERPVEGKAFQIMESDYSNSYKTLCGSAWWANIRSSSRFDPATAPRWALADLKALEWLSKRGHPQKDDSIVITSPEGFDKVTNPLEFTETLTDRLMWLPELLLTGHPAVAIACDRSREHSGEDFTALLQAAEGSKDPDKQFRACLIRACYGVPYRMQPISMKPLDYGPCQMMAASGTGQLQLISAHLQHHTLFYASSSNSYAHQTHAILSLGALRELMFSSAVRHGITERSKLPPVLYHIPLHTRVPISPPFSSARTTDLSTAHLATMLSPSFLEDGEWVGYYDYRLLDAGEVHFDEIMTGIRFRATNGTSGGDDDDGRLQLEARDGRDKLGRFRLIGGAWRRTGVLQIIKEYQNGLARDWVAVMTPFGIVGCWSDHTWGGWLYLWKKSWVEG